MNIFHKRILYTDDDLLLVSKLSNELIVKGKGRLDKLPLFDLLKKDHPGLRVLHRLDYETSGVVAFAKTKEVEKAIIESSFAGWKKTYLALIAGRIGRNRGAIRTPLPARGKGKVDAETHYRVVERFANSTLVEVEMETGRHHQIRRHFAGIGHPLVLDTEYGNRKFDVLFRREIGGKGFFLHASRIEIPHPVTGEMLSISAPLPQGFQGVLKRLGAKFMNK